MKPTLYLTGPISGVENFELNFQIAEDWMRRCGYPVINPCKVPPIDLALQSEEEPWYAHEQAHTRFMRGDIAAMMKAGGLACLDGHRGSKGSHLEKRIAFELHIPIMTLAQWEALA